MVHILPRLETGLQLSQAIGLSKELDEYAHSAIFGRVETTQLESAIAVLQANDLYVYFATLGFPGNLEDLIADLAGDLAIMYGGTAQFAPSGISSIEYSCGEYTPSGQCSTTVCCSEYATQFDTMGRTTELPDSVECIHPMLPALALRNLRTTKKRDFTVGLINSGAGGKFPLELAVYLTENLPRNMQLRLSSPDENTEVLKTVARGARHKGIHLHPVIPLPDRRLVKPLDVLIYANAENYYTPYALTAAEAMAMGIPVICENKGFPGSAFMHERECLMFEPGDTKKVLEYIRRIKDNEYAAKQLAANGKLWAAGVDQIYYGNIFRSLIKELKL